MGSNNDSKKSCNKLVVKSGSDDMRAFYDFCIDFMMEDNIVIEGYDRTDELLSWCEDPEMIKMALIDIKMTNIINNKKRKP
ncbi:MAG: hypothetical protein N3B13_10400 [Deltaproteobacteria bacterium]|nr:hypothetical protein [Deltaproteobacteria bacterium]